MKKFLTVLALGLILASPSLAIVSPSISFLSGDQIMSQVLPQGKINVSANLEYWNPNEITGAMIPISGTAYDDTTTMMPIAADQLTSTLVNIPIRVSYGLTDNISLRFSTQYIKISDTWTNGAPYYYEGSGLGDSKIEMLYLAAKETADMPSAAVNIGADILSGKSANSLPNNKSDTSLPTGLNTARYYLSGIFGKTFGAWDAKAMLGGIWESTDTFGSNDRIYAPEVICSVCMATTAGAWGYGGELSGLFAGENIDDYVPSAPTSVTDRQDLTPISKISVTPFVSYKMSDNLTYKANIELPLATKGNNSAADMTLYSFKGPNVSIGVDWTI